MNDSTPGPAGRAGPDSTAAKQVRHFRQILLWPVYLLPTPDDPEAADRAAQLAADADNPWRPIDDEFGDAADFQERHYNEFVTFLPSVQRFLYGQSIGKAVRSSYGESPIRALRRKDIVALRVVLEPGTAPVTFRLAHVDLYFFFDIDIAMLAVEFFADDLPLATVQRAMFQIGRAYPGFWSADGRGGNCPVRAEWLDAEGGVLATSDYEKRENFLRFTCEHRAPAVAAHWDFVLRPLVLHQTDRPGRLRYRLLEYYRMPIMAYLAVAEAEALTASDLDRLALVIGPARPAASAAVQSQPVAPAADRPYDVYHDAREEEDWATTRHFVSGHALVVTGDADNAFFTNAESGYLARFRHQHFLLFLIAHFHRASLLMFSDRLASAVSQLHLGDAASVRTFRRETRRALETFLRFTHRYWFGEISGQTQMRALFALSRRHLGLDRLYADIRQELEDMSAYLEGESMRRQNASMVRLTVVTTFGLIGTVTTGFIGMNLIDWTAYPPAEKALLFLTIFLPAALLTLYTVKKSARLSEFLDALSSERLTWKARFQSFLHVWGKSKSSSD